MAARKSEASPPAALAQLAAALASPAGLQRAYLVRGEERYFRERALELVRARALEQGHELALHDTADPGFALQALLDDLTSAPLFGGARSVVLRAGGKQAQDLLSASAGKESALARAILARLGSGALEGTLVLSLDALRADHAIARAIVAAGGTLLDMRRLWDGPPPWSGDPREAELVQWLLGEARQRRIALNPDQAAYAAAMIGNDLHALVQELERIGRDGAAGLRGALELRNGGTPWHTADPIAAGDLPRALGALEALLQAGFAEKGGARLLDAGALVALVLGALQAKLRTCHALSAALARGLAPAEAAAAAGFAGKPQGAEALARTAQLRRPHEWAAMLDECSRLEARGRSGGSVDLNDLALYALRWRRSAPGARTASAPRAAGVHR